MGRCLRFLWDRWPVILLAIVVLVIGSYMVLGLIYGAPVEVRW